MLSSRQFAAFFALVIVIASCANTGSKGPDRPETTPDAGSSQDAASAVSLRVATFNASLFRDTRGELVSDLEGGDDPQARAFAEVVQRIDPDVILVNEVDWDAEGEAARLLAEEYLAVARGDDAPIVYPYRYVPTTNTGLSSGVDLDNDGEVVTEAGSQDYGNDSFGFGTFPGQYGMVIFSKYPIATDDVRPFQTFLWSSMPGNLLPTDWYSAAAIEVFRLSSKNHVDVPIEVGGRRLHLLASHPTPPSFDGPEDRNGRRNHDEIRFWADYVIGAGDYIVDDSGRAGGLAPDASFVVVGDLNSDPKDGDSRREALLALLGSDRVIDPAPASAGAVEKAMADGQANTVHEGDPALDTADFSDGRVGNLRVDYALPSSTLLVDDTGVFWPAPGEPMADTVDLSDHRLVWVDVTFE